LNKRALVLACLYSNANKIPLYSFINSFIVFTTYVICSLESSGKMGNASEHSAEKLAFGYAESSLFNVEKHS
jgi:hypothetical protein